MQIVSKDAPKVIIRNESCKQKWHFFIQIAFYDKFFFTTVWGFIHYNTMFWMCHGSLPIRLKCVFLHNKRNPKTHRESHDYDCGFPCSPFQAYYLMMACCGRTFCFDAVSRLNNQCLPDLCRGRCISGGSLSVFGSTFPPRWAVFWLSVCSA